MFHWMLMAPQALKSLLPVADSFSNEEMRTFSRIRAHQSASETFNTRLWRRKTKPASVNDFAIVVLATNKTCGAFPWQVSVISVLWNITFKKWFSSQYQKEPASYFNQYSRIFFRYIGWSEDPETDIVASTDSVSHLIYCVFRWYLLTFFCYCTAGYTRSIFMVT